MSLIGGNTPGASQRYSEQKILKYRNFVTKIWNASRFVITEGAGTKPRLPNELDHKEKTFLKKLEALEKKNGRYFARFQFNLALEDLYDFFWEEFSSDLLEYEKTAIRECGENGRVKQAKQFLLYVLERQLALLGDFAPFVTDAVHQQMLGEKK
jgi:valyl-tRNA synthetase